MAGTFLNNEKRCGASFTIEAMLVLSIVFLTIASMIQKAYILHDQVTGAMILEEAVERIRYSQKKEDRIAAIAKEEELRGNPRLWLKNYELKIEEETENVRGKASAGEWSMEIEIKKFQPEQWIRRYRALQEIGEWAENDGS